MQRLPHGASTFFPIDADEGGGAAPLVTKPPVPPPPDPATYPNTFSAWAQYVYFLRIPLMGFASLFVFGYLDGCTGLSSLTRGIATMSRSYQAFYAMFLAVALGNTCLICAKNIVRNGEQRFASKPPGMLWKLLMGDKPKIVWCVLFVAQLPALFLMVYLGCIAFSEEETSYKLLPGVDPSYWYVWVWLLVGIFMGLVFWYGVTLFYLWTYPDYPEDHPKHRAAALLFPHGMWGMEAAQGAPEPLVAGWIAGVLKRATSLSHEGYSDDKTSRVWEFHALSFVAFGWFFLLYLFLFPLTAPVVLNPHPFWTYVWAVLICGLLWWGSVKRRPKSDSPAKNEKKARVAWWLLVLFRLLLAGGCAMFIVLAAQDAHDGNVRGENAFPVLASVTVILIFVQWMVSSLSFFFDRFRMPVLLTAALLVGLVHWVLQFADHEHYFEAANGHRFVLTPAPGEQVPQDAEVLPAPEDLMLKRMQNHDQEPYIIVTATGGGIQAAEWTAQVMARLELAFRKDDDLRGRGYTFHDHVLLASGVSGGSVGLMPFMLEYTAKENAFLTKPIAMSRRERPQNDPLVTDLLSQRLTRAPGCSSLEAVAWGLEYNDLQQMLLPLHLWFLHDPKQDVYFDRTWALGTAFNRNLKDAECRTDPRYQRKDNFGGLATISNGVDATLGTMAGLARDGRMPAFSFNTTAVETGGRFLLSNYGVPQDSKPGLDFLPAESFLQAYAGDCVGTNRPCKDADLPMATAARLSATFPAVSSATRLPLRFMPKNQKNGRPYGEHFVDGGYYDNDGTGSVLEFLYAAVRDKKIPLGARILLVEIRDGDDLSSATNADAPYNADVSTATTWGTTAQMTAPLEALWNAGHVSVTRRNRNTLCLLEQAYGPTNPKVVPQLDVRHMVFGIPDQPKDRNSKVPTQNTETKPAPLSWKLTSAQQKYINERGMSDDIQAAIKEAVTWTKKRLPSGNQRAEVDSDQVCTVWQREPVKGMDAPK